MDRKPVSGANFQVEMLWAVGGYRFSYISAVFLLAAASSFAIVASLCACKSSVRGTIPSSWEHTSEFLNVKGQGSRVKDRGSGVEGQGSGVEGRGSQGSRVNHIPQQREIACALVSSQIFDKIIQHKKSEWQSSQYRGI